MRSHTRSWLLILATVAVAAAQEAPPVRRAAITIDDGPRPFFVSKALDIFDRYQVKVTFFNVGRQVASYPQLTAECARRGHEVENHTYGHPRLTSLSDLRIRSEVERTNTLIEAQTGRQPTFLRPPYGSYNQHVRTVAKALGMSLALWTIDPYDWQGSATAQRTASRVLSKLRPEAVILIHESKVTLAALPTILDGLKARGYQLVTLSELRAGPPKPVKLPPYIVIHCGVGSDDDAFVAKGFAYALENGSRTLDPPHWRADDELRFKLVLPAGSEGELRLDLVADDANAGARQRVLVADQYVGVFGGTSTVKLRLDSGLTTTGEVTVVVQAVDGGRAQVEYVSYEAMAE